MPPLRKVNGVYGRYATTDYGSMKVSGWTPIKNPYKRKGNKPTYKAKPAPKYKPRSQTKRRGYTSKSK